ncbi:MAG: helix-turn-helix domain-containing protein [Mucilaginibacter sp.]
MEGTSKNYPIEEHVIEFVRKLRIDQHLTQEDIGTIIGVKQTFIANIENPNHKAKYNLKHIDLLADHFGLSPREFLPEKSLSKVIPKQTFEP